MPRAVNGRDGIELAYDVSGPADAPVVAFVEGLGYARWMWNWQRERLDDYRTLAWDNRGTGDSDVPEGPYTVEGMAADFEAVLDDAGVDSCHVVGASMGGMIAQEYALEYDRAETLSLLCTSPGGEEAVPTPEATQERMFDVPEEYGEREALRYKMRPAMSEAFWSANEDVVERIVDWRLESDAPDPARAAQAQAVAAFDAGDRLSRLSLPTLVAHGTADRVVPPANGEYLVEAIPGARGEFVEGGSHLFFVERPDDVTARLRSFFDDHARA